MVTNVKMRVTPDPSERVQEIIFTNGGSGNPNMLAFCASKTANGSFISELAGLGITH